MKKTTELFLVLCLTWIGVLHADTPPQVINKLCSSNQFFSQIQPGPNNIQCTQPTYSGIANTPSFIDSITIGSNNVSLVNDTATPGNNKFYGTNGSGVLGYQPGGALTEATSSVLTISGGTTSVIGSGTSIQVKQASTSQSGYLSNTDWNTFNGKQGSGNYITALSTDVSASGPGSVIATIQPNVVSNSKLAQMSANTLKGNNTGLSANALDLTTTQVNTLLGTITALTGDATASGPGSAALTLATVNANTGSFGSASSAPSFTVNGKGLLTAASSNAIQITESQVTNLVSDLAGKQATGNYITALTGDVTGSGPGSTATTLASSISGAKTFSTSLTSPIFSSSTLNPATAGVLRLANADAIEFRNAANNGNILLTPGSSDGIVSYGGFDLANISSSQTLSSKTLTAPTINAGTVSALTGFSLRDTSAAFNVTLGATSSSTLTGSQTVTIDTANSSSTLKMGGNLTVSSAATVSGTNTGDVSLAAVGSAPSANGASLSGQALTLQPADNTHPGLLSTAAQTIAGAKSLSSNAAIGLTSVNSSSILRLGNTLTGVNSYGVLSDYTGTASQTNTEASFVSDLNTTASAYTVTNRLGFYHINETKGAGSTIGNDVAFYSTIPNQGTSFNAILSDNLSGTGSYGINLTSANKNLLTGATAIGGTTTNDNASAGFVGEAVRANVVVGSAITITGTVTWQNITSISLTAGDWDVSGIASFGVGTGTGLTNIRGAISINSGTTITDQVWGDNMISTPSVPTGSSDAFLPIPSYRISLSGTTTVYLKGYCNFSGGAPVFYGRISARRAR